MTVLATEPDKLFEPTILARPTALLRLTPEELMEPVS